MSERCRRLDADIGRIARDRGVDRFGMVIVSAGYPVAQRKCRYTVGAGDAESFAIRGSQHRGDGGGDTLAVKIKGLASLYSVGVAKCDDRVKDRTEIGESGVQC